MLSFRKESNLRERSTPIQEYQIESEGAALELIENLTEQAWA